MLALRAGATKIEEYGFDITHHTHWEGAFRNLSKRIVWRCGHKHADRGVALKCSGSLLDLIVSAEF